MTTTQLSLLGDNDADVGLLTDYVRLKKDYAKYRIEAKLRACPGCNRGGWKPRPGSADVCGVCVFYRNGQ